MNTAVPRCAMNSWAMSIHFSSFCRKPYAKRFSIDEMSLSISLSPLDREILDNQNYSNYIILEYIMGFSGSCTLSQHIH